ncbi:MULTISPECIES: SGNH/GDSL hydrolase family protein [Paenibacillus]|uniref:Uncharacterized protein n=1 Tax=Paenibacillus vini TaxID=1476024 RepID=A0ABQ4M7I9_9BACL|nr:MULTISPECIES: SGNH/GDSL hydrolase family protein [Paenibacillus]MBQ4897330.1 SGNH/GDSL hydrolase family protein [Paenibacillus sp. Marseille-P2973]GIP51937.1 hypothetical protein J42TS3_09720 [Paenibacillus vini]
MKIRNLEAGRKKQLFILGGGIVLFFLLLVIRPSASEAKATWLWNTKLIQQHSEDIIAFAKKQKVKIIFLQIGGNVKEESYRNFIREASSAGLEVHALDGKPEWALREQRREADAFLEWVKEYNAASQQEERFTGVQFDVEPYLLDDWQKRQTAIVKEWVENARSWTQSAKEMDLEIGAAVPFWLNDIDYPGAEKKKPLNRWMVEEFDYVAIMAYRDEADRIYTAAKATLEEGDRQKKPVWVGVELGKSKEGPGVSFHGKSFTFLTGEINKLVRMVKGHSSFAGIAIHSYEPWRDKLAKWEQSLKK